MDLPIVSFFRNIATAVDSVDELAEYGSPHSRMGVPNSACIVARFMRRRAAKRRGADLSRILAFWKLAVVSLLLFTTSLFAGPGRADSHNARGKEVHATADSQLDRAIERFRQG